MDWLEQHLYDFVFPGLLALSKAPGLEGAAIERSTIKPFQGRFRPSSESGNYYSGLLIAALKSFGLWDRLPTYNKVMVKRSAVRLDSSPHHLATYGAQTNAVGVAHTFLKNSVRDLKKRLPEGNKVIFLGRDVWPWYVLGQKMGLPCIYESVVSRRVSEHVTAYAELLSRLDIRDHDILYDTGFAGSIHRNTVVAMQTYSCRCQCHPDKLGNLMFSAVNNANQQFKNHGLARNKALHYEYWPKYFRSGTLSRARDFSGYVSYRDQWNDAGVPVQYLSDFLMFVETAVLTIWLWTANTPNRIPGPAKFRNKSKDAKPWAGIYW